MYNYRLLKIRRRLRSQVAVEYAMVIAILIGALLAMQIYLKRSIQGKVREVADEIGEQYSAKTTTSDIVQRFSSRIELTQDPVIMNITDPVTAENKEYELSFVYRSVNQLLTHEPASEGGGPSWEQTGNFSSEGIYE